MALGQISQVRQLYLIWSFCFSPFTSSPTTLNTYSWFCLLFPALNLLLKLNLSLILTLKSPQVMAHTLQVNSGEQRLSERDPSTTGAPHLLACELTFGRIEVDCISE